MKKLFLTILLLSSFAFSIFADITDSFPNLSGRVVDNAKLLTKDQIETLSSILKAHEEKTSNQIVIVSLNSLEGYDIADYSYQLGRYWGIGQKDKDNGVLLVIAFKDRKLRIEVGYGLEGALTDKISHEIIEYTLKPSFKKQQYYTGINTATEKIIDAINGEYTNHPQARINDNTNEFIPLIFFGIIFLSVFGNSFSRVLRKQTLYKVTKSSIPSSFFAFFVYAMGSVFTAYSLILALIIFIVVFVFNFINTKDVDFDKLKSLQNNSSSTRSTGYGGFGGGGFSSSSGGFSGGGGGFGGGGASGGW